VSVDGLLVEIIVVW
jgi:hypothetical protein